MKLIEKLAEKYAQREAGPHPGFGHPGEPYWHRTYVASKKAYVDAFRKAREMAIQKMSDTPHASFRLQDLGEEEVKDSD